MSHTRLYPFLAGGGRAGELIRNCNWSASPIGVPDEWPRSLRTLIRMMLASPVPTAILWGTELITFYNDAFGQGHAGGSEHSSWLGKYGKESWAEFRSDFKTVIQSVMAGGEAATFQDHQQPFDHNSTVSNRTYTFSPLADDTDTINGVLVTCSETEDDKESTGPFGRTQECLQNLIGNASSGIMVLSMPDMRITIVNEAFARLTGRQVNELQGQHLPEVLPEMHDSFPELINKVFSTGTPQSLFAQPYSALTGEAAEEGFLDLVFQPYKGHEGQITGVSVTCNDVTRQVLDSQKLLRSEARLRSLVESAPFPIGVYVGPEMVIRLVNQTIIDIWGKGPDIVGKRYAEVLPELEGKGIYEQLDSVYRTGQAYYAHNQHVELMIDGELKPFYFKYTFTPLFDSDGKVYGVMNTAADVTDLVVAQQQLQEADAGLRGAIELAQLGSWELDLRTGQVSYSEVIRSWFGFDQASTALSQVYNPIHPQDRETVEQAINKALEAGSSGVYDAEYRLVTYLTDVERVVHARGKVLYDSQGQAYKLAGTAQDVTAERRREEELEHLVQLRTRELAAVNEELATLNEELATHNEEYLAINEELEEANRLLTRSNENLQQFAYVASHDLQEPLRKIQQFGDILKNRYIGEIGEGAGYLQRMQAAASRMSALIRDLLDFSSISTYRDNPKPVDLNEVVITVLSDLELTIVETGARLQVGMLPVIQGNALQLGQLFQNLLSNALKFRRPDQLPVIQVSSGTVRHSELPPLVKPTRLAGKYHRIEITDNGIGFDEKYANRIFQVFQRLHGKNEYAGTGIGLAICEKVVSNHGGAISAAGRVGQGATFVIYLPV
ncbi:PAS domain-containing protein [Dyadobacter flavalbus]|uniref:histidine kinase n=1 Tax=Dyadobacter flavalbus TaxID=2579942 RepID=A0A5M8QUH9_9BACT|nr:PAS domain-containing protein [Dyadobacter flavalbus]KAA6438296.1 PAS domain-containing protein [Dyadobacter flavalbus]